MLTLYCACSKSLELSQTVVFIDAEPAARAQLASLEVQAIGPTNRREPAVKAQEPHWPVKLVLLPKNGDARRRFTLEVSARDADEHVRTELRIKSGFVANQTRYARVIIRDACVAQLCNDDAKCGVWTIELDPSEFGRTEDGVKTWRASCVGRGVDPPDETGMNPLETTPVTGGAGGNAQGGSAASPGSAGAGASTGGPRTGPNGTAGTGCAAGFIANAGECVDIDECETFGKCAEHGRCENLPGSFHCVCDAGFEDTAGACTDIDECQTNNGGCEGACENSLGSAACTCAANQWLKADRKACGAAEPARQLSLGSSTIPMEPRFAFDASGNGLAVMLYSNGTATSLWTRRFVTGTGWAGSPGQVSIDASAGAPSEPRVALDASGRGVVMWLQTVDSRNDVWAASYDGSQIGTAAKLEQDDTRSAFDPAIRLNSGGEGFATWTQSDGEHARIWVNHLRPGAGWSGAAVVPSSTTEEAFAARLAIDDAGNASLVWTQALVADMPSTSQFTPWSVQFDAMAGRWRLAGPLDDSGSAGYADTQMFGVEGKSVAVWPRYVDGRVSIVARSFAPAAGWSEAVAISTDTSEYVEVLPSVSLSAAGSGAAVWTQTQGSIVRVWGSRYDGPTGNWSGASALRMRTDAIAPEPQIAVDSAGDGLAVWSEIAGTSRSIWLWRLQADQGFTEGTQLRTDETAQPPANSAPQIAVDAQGNGIAIWDVQSGGNYTVWASRFE